MPDRNLMGRDATPVYETPKVIDHGTLKEITAGSYVYGKRDSIHATHVEHESSVPIIEF